MKIKLLLITFMLFMSCSPYQKFFRYDYQQSKAKRIKSIVVTPIDLIRARPQGTDFKTINRFEMKIKEYLSSNGYTIQSNEPFLKNWKIEADKLDGFFDPSNGKLDDDKIILCLVKAINKTKEEQEFNGVLFIQLIERPAKLMSDRVYWDGCSREIFDEKGDIIPNITWRGEMKGLSLHVQLIDGNNHLIFQNIGAIEFPFELTEDNTGKQFV